jgi:hypothetical protein
MPSNYPPGVTGTEWQIVGPDDDALWEEACEKHGHKCRFLRDKDNDPWCDIPTMEVCPYLEPEGSE